MRVSLKHLVLIKRVEGFKATVDQTAEETLAYYTEKFIAYWAEYLAVCHIVMPEQFLTTLVC